MKSLLSSYRLLFVLLCCSAMSLLGSTESWAVSTTVVISQIYGGGGNAGSTYKNDFIELHNISGSPINVAGWSVQYSSATGTSWQVTPLSGTIASGGYFLVQESAGTNGTTSLPTPDVSGTIAVSATAGKIALVSSTGALTVANPPSTSVVDLIGFGTTANGYEGTGPAPAPTNTTGDLRKDNGSTDTDNNASDFTVGAPAPRNSASPTYLPAATQVSVETAIDGSGTTVTSQAITAGSNLKAFAISRTSSGSFSANIAATWSLVSITGGVVASDLVPSSDNKSAIFTPHAAGSAVISATASGLTTTTSGTITVNAAPSTISGTGAASAPKVSANQNELITVAVTPAGSPPSTGITVTANLTAFGLSATTQLYDDGTHGDVTAGDGIYSFQLPIGNNPTGGATSVPVTISDAQGRTNTTTVSFQVLGSFTIYHSNDCHARITPHMWQIPAHSATDNPFQQVGGAAYMAGEVLSLVNSNPIALYLDGGDISEGNPIGDQNGNQGVVGFFQLLSQKLKNVSGRGTTRGIDAFVVGNHDVRYLKYIQNLQAAQADFPIISMNVCKTGVTPPTPLFPAYTTVTVNGTKVGIIGYTTESSQVGPDAQSTLYIAKCDWSSSDSSKVHLADYVNLLRNQQGCDVVILLTHDGHSDLCTPDTSGSTPVLADTSAAKVPEIAITGHWHTWCDSVWQPQILNYKTIFMESASYIKYVGELNVTGAGKYLNSVQHVLLDSAITPDPDVANYVAAQKTAFNTSTPAPLYQADQILGYTSTDLLLDKKMKWWSSDEFPWDGDNTAGEFICDGMQWAALSDPKVNFTTAPTGGVQMSMEVGGGVRSDIPAGPMTYTAIYEMFPWDDDQLWVVKMSSNEIWNFIQSNNCDVGISKDWHVSAVDGIIQSITYQGNPITQTDTTTTFNVAINSYMYANNTFLDKNPVESTYLCRSALMDYAQQWPQSNPLVVGTNRYNLNTDFSGGYRAVVTMMNDADSSPTFDDAFVRLESATPETLARRGSVQVPTNLVNADGSINHANRLAEIEEYRSYLGFRTGALKPGDIIETYGKGGFFDGDPEFVDQEGVYGDGQEFNIVGHDDTLAQPEYYANIGDFYNNTLKNHYVKFYAKKTGTNTVVDANNNSLSIMDVTAYDNKTLPGNVGDLLQLTGVTTSETSAFSLRFRCDSVVEASSVGVNGFPPTSAVNAVPSGTQTNPSLTLTATATATNGGGVNTIDLVPTADAQVTQGSPSTNYGTSTSIYVQSAASGSFQNERGWLKFDLSTLPAGTTINTATLKMYCWKAAGATLPAGAYSASTDSWTETGLNWSNQPGFNATPLATTSFTTGATNLWYTWDVSSFVQSEFSGDKTVSLLVKAVTEGATTSPSPAYTFDTKEYGGSTEPVLEINATTPSGTLSISQLQYYYRFSVDGTTWGAWTAYQGPVTGAPYSVNFNYPSGAGYYQFYSVATDSAGTVEPTPAEADTTSTFLPGATPGATDTPTLPQWGLIIMGMLLCGYAATQLRTRMHLFIFVVLVGVGVLFLVSSRLHAGVASPKTAKIAAHQSTP